MTLLTMCQDVADRIGLPRPSAIVGSLDQTAATMLSLANREGRGLAKRTTWTGLQKEFTWSTVAAETQFAFATAIPDFDFMLNETIFNRSQFRELGGPLQPQEWQRIKAQNALGPYPQFRIQGGVLKLVPIPNAGMTAALEYYSRNWCQSVLGAGQQAWAADTDTGVLPEDLMGLGLEWRFVQAKGLDYAEAFRDYEMQVAQAMGRDGSRRTLGLDDGDAGYASPRSGPWR